MYVPYQLEEPWKCLYMVKPGSRDTQNKALEQSLWNKWLEFCTVTYYQCLKELFLRVTFTQQLPVNSLGLNTWLLDMKNIDFFFFNNRQSCPLKKKNRKIKKNEIMDCVSWPWEKRGKRQQNKYKYVHTPFRCGCEIYGISLEVFCRWEVPSRPVGEVWMPFKLVIHYFQVDTQSYSG